MDFLRSQLFRTRRFRGLVAAVVVLAFSSGCIGARSQIIVPACVERFEVTGEHHRVSETQLVLNHGLDLPFTQTEITVERVDGSREVVTVVNSTPDLLRLFAAGIVGILSAGAVGLYAYQVGVGNEGILGPTFWALPVGAAGATFALSIALTGWSPPADTVVPARCAEGS